MIKSYITKINMYLEYLDIALQNHKSNKVLNISYKLFILSFRLLIESFKERLLK